VPVQNFSGSKRCIFGLVDHNPGRVSKFERLLGLGLFRVKGYFSGLMGYIFGYGFKTHVDFGHYSGQPDEVNPTQPNRETQEA
jgi:hypothetical protein